MANGTYQVEYVDDYETDEMQDEYDFTQMNVRPTGRYAPGRRIGKNVRVLAPDVSDAFATDDSVNEALRLILQLTKIPQSNGITSQSIFHPQGDYSATI